jgi:DnaJ-class molecular chaperone
MPSLYDVLGVDRKADTNEIRKAYLRLSKTHHPDKGGDAEEFKKINKANEILTDDGRRAMYDQTGQEEEGGHPGGMGGFPGGMGGFPGGPGGPFSFPFDMGNLFGMFGGPGGPQGKRQQERQLKGPPKVHELPISLKDYYYGTSMKLNIDRQKLCEACKGSGSEEYKSCAPCSGSGHRQTVIMMGPGMQGIMRGPCPDCNGEGKVSSRACGPCNGTCFVHEQKTLDIRIEPGMLPKHTIVFKNACSEQKEYMEPGDVHIVLYEADPEPEKNQASFLRTGNDLNIRIEITLLESLIGGSRKLTGHPGYPDGLSIVLPSGILHSHVIPYDSYGMPVRGTVGYGQLKVLVMVKLSDSEKEVLKEKKDEIEKLFTSV